MPSTSIGEKVNSTLILLQTLDGVNQTSYANTAVEERRNNVHF